jgi:hypothetical protein
MGWISGGESCPGAPAESSACVSPSAGGLPRRGKASWALPAGTGEEGTLLSLPRVSAPRD